MIEQDSPSADMDKDTDKKLPAESWDFYPAKERFKENAISICTVVGYGAILSQVFNPVSVLCFGGFALAQSIWPHTDKDSHKKFVSENCEPEDTQDGMKSYYEDVIAAYTLKMQPSKTPDYKLRFYKEDIHASAGAGITNGEIFLPRGYMMRFTPQENHFVVAHEVSHLNDGMRVYLSSSCFLDWMPRYLWAGTALTFAGAALGAITGTPFFSVFNPGTTLLGAVSGMATLFGLSKLSTLVMNYVSREQERRADRNALFLTGDFKRAASTLLQIHHPIKEKQLFETDTHPSAMSRFTSLQKSFALVSRYQRPEINLPYPPEEIVQACHEVMEIRFLQSMILSDMLNQSRRQESLRP